MKINIIHLPHRVDRLKLLKTELKEQKIKDYKIWDGIIDTTLPCRGISKAHKQIILDAKVCGLPEVLIAEDDLHFTAPGAFNFFLSNKPNDYDLYLAGIVYGKIMNNNIVNDFSGTTFYLVNARFYETILTIPEEQHLDRALKDKGKYIICNPLAVIPHNGYSDNYQREFDYHSYLRDKELFGKRVI